VVLSQNVISVLQDCFDPILRTGRAGSQFLDVMCGLPGAHVRSLFPSVSILYRQTIVGCAPPCSAFSALALLLKVAGTATRTDLFVFRECISEAAVLLYHLDPDNQVILRKIESHLDDVPCILSELLSCVLVLSRENPLTRLVREKRITQTGVWLADYDLSNSVYKTVEKKDELVFSNANHPFDIQESPAAAAGAAPAGAASFVEEEEMVVSEELHVMDQSDVQTFFGGASEPKQPLDLDTLFIREDTANQRLEAENKTLQRKLAEMERLLVDKERELEMQKMETEAAERSLQQQKEVNSKLTEFLTISRSQILRTAYCAECKKAKTELSKKIPSSMKKRPNSNNTPSPTQ
jgi:hypothetical protein